ncbi:MAG: Flagellar motor rotation protein MotB [Candidatus Jettenia ecosi]|uniref:Flagellar motor rotation protein MotB n=1 Tax=Candidatus Jettenia ecosi TaxID=2494326 RepID=A0A533QR16_9BACT|nr:MAG: Flagellar motor rotation protein MotB [Candidatus Jettenia ecosi]
MFKRGKYVKFLLLIAFIGMTGCAELNELRDLNRRQAITIRDQSEEIDNLEKQLSSVSDRLKSSEAEMSKLRQLAKSIGGGVSVRDTVEGPVILFPEKILFDSGMATIKSNGEKALGKMAGFLDENPSISIRIDGHTDTDPIIKTKHLWDSNHHLSAARALSVFHFLTKTENIAEKRIHVAGFGPNRPIAPNTNSTGKKGNRRVEFLILTSVASLPPKDTSLSEVEAENPYEIEEESEEAAPAVTEESEE